MNSIAEGNIKTEYKKGYKKTKLGWIPDDWDMVRFDELFEEVINLSSDLNSYPLYSLTLENGVTPKTERYERSHLLKDKAENKFKLIQENEIAINPMNLRFGAFFKSKISKTVALSAYYNIVKLKNNSINIDYYDLFMKSILAKRLYQSIATGSLEEKKRVHLSELNKQSIPFPNIKEQNKIADILTKWDEEMEVLEKLIEKKQLSKKALMQKLLTGKIRFNEFKSSNEYKKTKLGLFPTDWQVKKLKELFNHCTEKKTGIEKLPVLTNSAIQGVIFQGDYFDRDIVTESNTNNYYLVNNQAFMYNPRISKTAPAGPINMNKLGCTGIASPLYTIFEAKDKENIDFYDLYFASNLWNIYMESISNQGARHDRLNISINDFMNMPIPMPKEKELHKITDFLNTCDEEIKLLNFKLEKLKQQRKGLMQKLLTGQVRVKF